MTPATYEAAVAAALGGAGVLELLAARPGRRSPRVGQIVLAALTRLGRRRGAPLGLEDRLAAAGVGLPASDFAALRAGAALAALLAVVPLASAGPGRSALVLLIGAPAAAHLAPPAWLARRTRRRARAIEAEIADVLDLLRVALDAGLPPFRALAEAGRRHPGRLARELQCAAGRRALGVPAAALIDELERRCPGEGVGALCGALRRAERHGSPLAAALAAQARQARAREAARAAEAAARAAPRIQVVVALVLVPSVLLLIAAGLLPALAGEAGG